MRKRSVVVSPLVVIRSSTPPISPFASRSPSTPLTVPRSAANVYTPVITSNYCFTVLPFKQYRVGKPIADCHIHTLRYFNDPLLEFSRMLHKLTVINSGQEWRFFSRTAGHYQYTSGHRYYKECFFSPIVVFISGSPHIILLHIQVTLAGNGSDYSLLLSFFNMAGQ